jgi:hypothetical protein
MKVKLIMEKTKPLLERVPLHYRSSVSLEDEEFLFDYFKNYNQLNLTSAYFCFNDSVHPPYTTYTDTVRVINIFMLNIFAVISIRIH